MEEKKEYSLLVNKMSDIIFIEIESVYKKEQNDFKMAEPERNQIRDKIGELLSELHDFGYRLS